MKTLLTVIVLTVTALAQQSDEKAILALHEHDREAHLRGDANLLTADMAPEIMDVGRGHFDRTTRDQVREHFTTYFKQAKYSSFDDMVAPAVHVAPDGKSAWMAVQIRAHITNTEPGKVPAKVDF